MNEPGSTYRVYLLSIWKEQCRHVPHERWRFRLENPRTGQSQGFANAAALVAALLNGAEMREDLGDRDGWDEEEGGKKP